MKVLEKFKAVIVNNIGIKIISLIIAIILWLLVSGVVKTMIKGDMIKV